MALVMLPTAATAAWSAAGTGTAAVAAPALTNASGLLATCSSTKVAGKFPVTITWTASPHQAVTGYEIERTGGADGTVVISVSGRTTTTASDAVTPAANAKTTVTYSYTIRARSGSNWTTSASGPVTVSATSGTCA